MKTNYKKKITITIHIGPIVFVNADMACDALQASLSFCVVDGKFSWVVG